LIKGLDLALQFDTVNQINCDLNVFATQGVKKGILQLLAFCTHVIALFVKVRNCTLLDSASDDQTLAQNCHRSG
jgi:hypothetical protein